MDIMSVCSDDAQCVLPLIFSFCQALHLVFLHRSWPECAPHVPWGELSEETQRFHDSHNLNFHRIWESHGSNHWHQVRLLTFSSISSALFRIKVETNWAEKQHFTHLLIIEAKLLFCGYKHCSGSCPFSSFLSRSKTFSCSRLKYKTL